MRQQQQATRHLSDARPWVKKEQERPREHAGIPASQSKLKCLHAPLIVRTCSTAAQRASALGCYAADPAASGPWYQYCAADPAAVRDGMSAAALAQLHNKHSLMPSWANSAVASTPKHLQQASALQQTSRGTPSRLALWWAPPPGLPRDFRCCDGPMAMAGSRVGWLQGLVSSVPLVWPCHGTAPATVPTAGPPVLCLIQPGAAAWQAHVV